MPGIQGGRIEARNESPVQADGDLIGAAHGIRAGVYPGALLVRQLATAPATMPSFEDASSKVTDELLLSV